MCTYTLGLDLGSNSIGWAAIGTDGHTFDNGRRIFAGVRIFPEGVADPNTGREKPRGQARREARGMRRVHQRRSQRKRKLMRILTEAGLLPKERAELRELLALEPYHLRQRGLDEGLSLFELGRALSHLCQRRGFKSNRKTGDSKEDGKVAEATAELQKAIDDAGCRTLGEYLAQFIREDGDGQAHRNPEFPRIRGPYTLRAMIEDEFDLLWEAQRSHHGDALTDELRAAVHAAIFDQRPVTWKRETIGRCELEPDEFRCSQGHWLGQQFRILQEINNLRYVDADTGEECTLSDQQRGKLAAALSTRKTTMSFDQIRKLLDLGDSCTFNLEDAGGRKSLKGNVVGGMLNGRAFKKWYGQLDGAIRADLHDALADIEDEDELIAKLRGWGLDDESAVKLAAAPLPSGRFRVSVKAMGKLMPHLQAGLNYTDAKRAAGYEEMQKADACDRLQPVDEVVEYLTNPLVHRALSEMRKAVNALVRECGKPGEIIVELGRDMKHSRDKRRELHFENLKRRKENDDIRKRLVEEFNVASPSRDDVIKFRLWEECGRVCPFTGGSISASALFRTGDVQIEHILPYSRSLDDSYMNKTLCFVDENRRKGNRTPWEAYQDDGQRYAEIVQRVERLPYPKRRRFTQKELELDTFVERQLNDMRYISRQAVSYLRSLGVEVRCVKGGTTAELRHQWGLNDLLDPLAQGQKTRDDHRHHAVDAAVVAMTTRSALQKLSTVKYAPQRQQLDPPWRTFRDDLQESVNDINVSFRPMRKLAGKLHEETNYGPGQDGKAVVRVKLAELSYRAIGEIRDGAIRRHVQEAVDAACSRKGIGLTGSDKLAKGLGDDVVCMPSGVPIRKVRIERAEKTLVPIRSADDGGPICLVKPGGNHHVEIFETADGKWTGRAVTRFEAHRRWREGSPIVDRRGGDGERFVMALCINDMLEVAHPKTGRRALYRVQSTSVSSPVLTLRLHTATRTDDKDPIVKATRHLVAMWDSLRKLTPRKVTVDPLGRIHPCND